MAKRSDACVYVIRLDTKVLTRKAFAKANPGHDPRKPCVYVGSTGLTPEERFANHKRRYKAGRFVPEFGVELMPKRYQHIPRMPREEAEKKERELALRLRRRGYAVWGGSAKNADINKPKEPPAASASGKAADGAQGFVPTTAAEKAEAFRLGAELLDALLTDHRDHAEAAHTRALALEGADEAAIDPPRRRADARSGVPVWKVLVRVAHRRQTITCAELAASAFGKATAAAAVTEPLFMVVMYCFLSSLPNLAAVVADFDAGAGVGEAALRASWEFDWRAHPTPRPTALLLALHRLTDNL